ncbi:hypothetical protein JTB14_011687 [Gonioctena quinquepunctata]|nr:hypothetical protein JTB14_011687 [Gonioctena quinquepunctata]
MVEHHKIKIVQTNLQYSRSTTSKLIRLIERYESDIIACQEPYVYLKDGKYSIPGFSDAHCAYVQNVRPMAAIIIKNQKLDVIHLKQFTSEYVVAIQVTCPQFTCIIASVYCEWNRDLGPRIDELQNVVRQYRGTPVLLLEDFNAKSNTWHSNTTNNRGAQLEHWMSANNLQVLNEPHQPFTFHSLNEGDNIDISIASGNMLELTKKWSVKAEVIESDHRPILMTLCKPRTEGYDEEEDGSEIGPRYCTRRIDTAVLNYMARELNDQLAQLPLFDAESIDEYIEALTKGVMNITDTTCRNRKPFRARTPWWSERLITLKAGIGRTRRAYQGARLNNNPINGDEVATARVVYTTALTTYRMAIKEAKSKSWNRFVEEDLGSNPWGTVTEMDEIFTSSHQDTIEAILNRIIPDDLVEDDNQDHQAIRHNLQRFVGENDMDLQFQKEWLETAIHKINPNRAPGPDGVPGTVLALAYSGLEDQLTRLYGLCFNLAYFPDAWKQGNLITILKAPDKDPSDPKSLRPITLLSELGKVLKRIIKYAMLSHFGEEDLFHSSQFGFRSGRSTVHAVNHLLGHKTTIFNNHHTQRDRKKCLPNTFSTERTPDEWLLYISPTGPQGTGDNDNQDKTNSEHAKKDTTIHKIDDNQ